MAFLAVKSVKRALILAALVIGVLVPAVSATAGTGSASATTVVRVTGKEFSFALSRKSGPRGTLVFRFTNRGTVPHDFKIARKKTPLVQPGKSATLTVKITKRGRYPYVCTVPGHAAAGMKGVFTVK
jgi:plastocyanin